MVLVYVLRCPSTGLRYVGITDNLARRERQHRAGHSKGSEHLGGSFAVLFSETYATYDQARTREKFLKSGQGRKWIDTTFPFVNENAHPAGVQPARGG
jgi:predicted GIY-YIG superfamily endonuclease